MGEDLDQRCCCSGEDRISGLPDELLHDILVRLRSAHAAALTSVLSRRWRHVWAHLPELRLDDAPQEAAPASFMDSVDAALGGYLSPTLEHLGISICTDDQLVHDQRIAARRIAPWLRFAAERVVGELFLFIVVEYNSSPEALEEQEVVLELPVCGRAKQILFFVAYAHVMTWLRPQASGLFTLLTSLKIWRASMDGHDLTTLVCTQCPCLRDLSLSIMLIVNFDVSIHSNSLCTLVLRVRETRRLEIMAPRLEELSIEDPPMEAHISAPKLVKVAWRGAYDPRHNRFVDVGRTLQQLKTTSSFYQESSLTKRFDEVDELDMNINIYTPDVATYERFLNETNKLPKCKSFCISLSWEYHALLPVMLQLLSCCNGPKKFRVQLWGGRPRPVIPSCPPSCPCRLEESRKIDGIDLISLEEVEIEVFSYSHEQMELVELLSCNARNLKRLLIDVMSSHWPKDVLEKVRSICHPNVKVEYIRKGRQVSLD